MVHAALDGTLAKVPMRTDPNFGIEVPTVCPGVPVEILNPRNTWANGADYDAQAGTLARMFTDNFRTYADAVTEDVRAAGPEAR